MPRHRWDPFFEDLEHQFAAERESAREETAGEAERLRIARLSLRQRFVAAGSARVVVDDATGETHRVTLEGVGADWIAGTADDGRGLTIVRLDAVDGVRFDRATRERSVGDAPEDPLVSRMGLGFVLRALARSRTAMSIGLLRGRREVGTASRVGADHVDLVRHDLGEVPRASDSRGEATIAFRAIAWVRTAARRDVRVF